MFDLWIGSLHRRARGRRLRVGPDLLVRHALPQARRRAAGADPLQPADRDPLHGRAVPDRLGALLLHGDRADRRQQAVARTRTSTVEVVGVQVELEVQLPRRQGTDGARPASTRRLQRRTSRCWCCRPTGRSGSRSTQPDVIHSFWVPELLFKRDVFPGNIRNEFEITILDAEGAYVGRCAELCGTLPLDDELRAAGGLAGEVRPVPRGEAERASPPRMRWPRSVRQPYARRPRSRSTRGGRRTTATRTTSGPHGKLRQPHEDRVRIFLIITGFLFACRHPSTARGRTASPAGVEWVGIVALLLSGLLCSMCGGYFWFVSRRIDLRPEDRAGRRDRRRRR